MINFFASSPIRDWIRSTKSWNVVMHLNPGIRTLGRDTAHVFANSFSLYSWQRLFGRRIDSHKAPIVLIPEICPHGFIHCHGFAYFENPKIKDKFIRKGPVWWERDCRNLFNGGKAPLTSSMRFEMGSRLENGFVTIKPSAEISSVRLNPQYPEGLDSLERAVEYACKDWEKQEKESLAVFYGQKNS